MEKRQLKIYRYTSIWKEDDDDDIICWEYSPNIVMDINVATELVQNRMEYTGGKNVYALVDVVNVKSITKEAREYMSHPETGSRGLLAGAFISNKPVTTMLTNLFLAINKPSVPVKFFTNKDEGLKWLKKIKREQLTS